MSRRRTTLLSVLWIILAVLVAVLNFREFSWVDILTTAIAWMGGIGTTLLFFETRNGEKRQ